MNPGRVGVMKVGHVTVAIDGTKMEARAAVRAVAERVDYGEKKAGREAMREQGKSPVTKRVSQAANDKRELVENVRAIDPVIQSVGTVLIDSVFVSVAAVTEVETS